MENQLDRLATAARNGTLPIEGYVIDPLTMEAVLADKARKAKRKARRNARDDAMRSLGLVKVRGAMGGTYWE